jgi:hypothetical protein
MKIYTIEELEAEGIDGTTVKTEFKINCFNKTFIRATDLPKRFKSKALDSCQEYQKQGFDCFVVETPLFFSVWKEEKLPIPKTPSYSNSIGNYQSTSLSLAETEVKESNKELGTKPSEPVIVNPAPSKPSRKYRGIDYS